MANITFDQLPLNAGLAGTEIVPVDTPLGNGNFITGRTTTAAIANLAGSAGPAPVVLAQANPLFPQARVLAATVGDITLADAGPQSTLTIDLAATTVTPGTYGSTSAIAQFTVDQKGRLQAAGNIDISGTYQPLSANLTSWAAITRAAGFDTWVGAPSSANLRALMTDETGTGALYFQGGDIGTPSAGVLTNATGLPVGTGISGLAANMAAFLAGGTSAQLAAAVTDETGSGALVFGTAPTISLASASTAVTQTLGDNSTKLATTAFVQAAVNATTTLPATKYATTAALPAVTYANGSSGVGATLTENANGALTVDGIATAVNDVILVKNQASTFQNGIYTVTATGSAGAPFVLTRATYYNVAADINLGDNTFISAGATLAGTTWQQNGTEQPVIGTNPITFAQVAGPGTYTAGNGLTLTGTQFAIDTSVTVDKNTAQTVTNKTINGSNNTITNVSLTTGITGTLGIGNGGTGQITASAAFDALSPTTTRGDLIYRNATTNARLAASTAGYLLQTNGTSADPSWVGFLQTGTGAVTRTWLAKVQERVSVKDFGAAGDGVTNDTTAVQAALNAALAASAKLYFPPGSYLCGALSVAGCMEIYGDGENRSIIVSTVTGATDAFSILPPATGLSNTFCYLHDISINPTTAGNGRYSLYIGLQTGAFFSNFSIERVQFGQFGTAGIVLDNSAGNTNGFFTGTIRRCYINNGILGVNVGDSIDIEENTITAGPSGTACGITLTGLSGARQYVIKDNNITARGGSINLTQCDQAHIINNQCEHGWFLGSGTYTGPVDSQVYLNNCYLPTIVGNTINPFCSFNYLTSNGTTTNGSASITGITGTPQVGTTVTGTGIPANTTVLTSPGGGSITISNNATASGTVSLQFIANPNGPSGTLTLNGTTSMAEIHFNDIKIAKFVNLNFLSGVSDTRVGRNGYYGIAPTVSDSGTRTAFVTGPYRLRKTTTQSIASSTALTSDTALQFAMAASKTYQIRIVAKFNGPATPGFQYALTGPASPTSVRVDRWIQAPAATAFVKGVDTAYTTAQTVTGNATTQGYIEMDITVANGVNAGTFAFQWAQAVSNATPSTVELGSYLEWDVLN